MATITWVLLPAALGAAFVLWDFCRVVVASQREKVAGWGMAPSRHRVMAAATGTIVGITWLAMYLYIAPSLIPAVRGPGVAWSDTTPRALLLDAVLVTLVLAFGLSGFVLSTDTANGVVKLLRHRKSREGWD